MNNQKLLGIELCRGIAAYSVILVHSGDENWGLAIDPSAIAFRLHFYFGVPFFLALAFYFMTAKPDLAYSAKFWRSRLDRVLLPYAIWSTIFLIVRVVVFTQNKQPDRLQELLNDPLSIVFFGRASYHLYFLALLLAGTPLVLFVPLLQQLKIGNIGLLLLSALSVISYYLLETSGNSFQLGPDVAFASILSLWKINLQFHPLLRLLVVEVAWIIKCLPYLFISVLLHKILPTTTRLHQSIVIGSIVLFITINIMGQSFIPESLQEIILSCTLLLLGISNSNHFKNITIVKLVTSIGSCSFGIYLIHPFVMNVVKSMLGKISPELTNSISISSMFALSIPCFLISWLAVAITKNKLTAKEVLGLRL